MRECDLENDKLRKIVVDLSAQQEKTNILNESLINRLHEKEYQCERLQAEVVLLRHDLERVDNQLS